MRLTICQAITFATRRAIEVELENRRSHGLLPVILLSRKQNGESVRAPDDLVAPAFHLACVRCSRDYEGRDSGPVKVPHATIRTSIA